MLEEYLPNMNLDKVFNLKELPDKLAQKRYDVLILDLLFPSGSSLDLLPDLCKEYPDLIVIIASGQSKIRVALNAMNAGANYYVVKDEGFESDLVVALRNADHQIRTRRNLERMISNIFDQSLYPMMVLKASDVGIEEVFRDFDHFPENLSNEDIFIEKIGLSLLVGIGQGAEYHTGIYQFPAAQSKSYSLIDFAFQLIDESATDPRLKTGYFHLVLFIPNSVKTLFPPINELESFYHDLTSTLNTASDLTGQHLAILKSDLFYELKEIARSRSKAQL